MRTDRSTHYGWNRGQFDHVSPCSMIKQYRPAHPSIGAVLGSDHSSRPCSILLKHEVMRTVLVAVSNHQLVVFLDRARRLDALLPDA